MKTLLLILILSLTVFAGDGAGNGGDVVVLNDNTIVLADPYYWQNERIKLHPELVKELRIIGDYLVFLGATKATEAKFERNKTYPLEESLFFNEEILSEKTKYVPMSELPNLCQNLEKPSLPDGATTYNAACTLDQTTYLLEKTFKKMSIREQAKLILHERLRTIVPKLGLYHITRVTNGVDIYLEQRQKIASEVYNPLNPVEVTQIEELRETIALYLSENPTQALAEIKNYSVNENGGGLIDSHLNFENSFVSLKSKITLINKDNYSHSKPITLKNTQIIDSQLEKTTLSLMNKVKISNSKINSVDLYLEDAIISNSSLMSIVNNGWYDLYELNEKHKIVGWFFSASLYPVKAKSSQIHNSEMLITEINLDNSSIIKSKIELAGVVLKVRSMSEIENTTLTMPCLKKNCYVVGGYVISGARVVNPIRHTDLIVEENVKIKNLFQLIDSSKKYHFYNKAKRMFYNDDKRNKVVVSSNLIFNSESIRNFCKSKKNINSQSKIKKLRLETSEVKSIEDLKELCE